jgi:diguanylate cyclase (GGDEF)-like protein/PAS domain S-box-containing protein
MTCDTCDALASGGPRPERGLPPNVLSAVFSSLPDAVVIVDPSGRIAACNAAVQQLLQYDPDDLVGRDVETLLPPEIRDVHVPLRTAYNDDRRVRPMGRDVDLFALALDGSRVPVDIALGPVRGADGYVCAVIRDATVSYMDRRRLRRLASQDPLTGLNNRRSAQALLQEALARALELGEPMSILVADIDQFKTVNDLFGHPVGDEMLIAVGDTLRGAVRSSDFCARFGGDEFVVGLVGGGSAGAARAVEQIRQALARITLPDGSRLAVSCGTSTAPQDGRELAPLIAAADQAMYASKRARSAPITGADDTSRLTCSRQD